MARFIVLDAGPLGLASQARGKPDADRCRVWLGDLAAAGARVVVPEIADYEIRRELLRAGAAMGIGRLDRLLGALEFDPISTPAMRRAAELWATVRRSGVPTAHPQAARCRLHFGGAGRPARRSRRRRDDRVEKHPSPRAIPGYRRPFMGGDQPLNTDGSDQQGIRWVAGEVMLRRATLIPASDTSA